MKKKASVAHDKKLQERLKHDADFAAAYLNTAIEEATDAEGRSVLLSAIRQIATARGIANVARAAGMKRESLSRALSSKGNPRFDTLYAVIHAMGLQLRVTAH